MDIKNPYYMRGMLPIDSDMFFGRKKEMKRINDMLSGDTPQSVSIIGERRIGKSSLALRLFHTMKNSKNTLAVFLDCDALSEDCRSKDKFFQILNQRFIEALEEKPALKDRCLGERQILFNNYTSFKAFVKRNGGNKIKAVIFLDEFEHLPQHSFADDTFFSNLRAAANHPENRLAFVTVSRTELKALTHRAIKSSGFWNIFDAHLIGLLGHPSIEELRKHGFNRPDLSLSGDEIEKIHYYAGDFPFFNQLVCSFLWDAKDNKESPHWQILEVKLSPYFEKLWEDRSKKEQKLLKTIVNVNDADDFALNEMVFRGLVIKEDNLYLPFSDYFSSSIEHRFKITRKKITAKEIIHYIKETLGLVKSGKEIVTRKGD